MNLDTLLERIQKVDLYGLLDAEKKVVTTDGKEGILVKFWRLKGAIKNDKGFKITMLIDPDTPQGDLYFYAPNLEECEPNELSLSIYMDANMKVFHGAHRWTAGEKGVVSFSYSLPLPSGVDDFPDVALLQRLLKDMYEGLLFRELKGWDLRITKDDMLSKEEKTAKYKKVFQIYQKLTNPRETEDGSV